MIKNTQARPEGLPDFSLPPLNEVVIGVQFAKPTGYQQINSRQVWDLYKEEYPKVEEHPPLEPSFEMFGVPSFSHIAPFNFLSGAVHDRFWFVNQTAEELIQFQSDRLLHNWREIVDANSEYPRFETMISKFEEELTKLQIFMSSLSEQSLIINQCEVSYINNIRIQDEAASSPDKWLKFCNFSNIAVDDFNFAFREVIKKDDGTPQGRLIVEAVTGLNQKSEKIIRLTLTVRGAPLETSIPSAINFISKGREMIVNRFAELTTDFAHQQWRRVK